MTAGTLPPISSGQRFARALAPWARRLVLAVFAVWCLFPLYWLTAMSLKRQVDAVARVPRFIFWPILDNYAKVLASGEVWGYFGNSLIVASGATALALQRTRGIERFLEDFKKTHKGKVTCEVIEATYDTSTEQSRVSAYAQAHPELTAAIDVANAFPMALAMQDLGYEPGKVKVGGFDVLPPVIDAITSGYQQVAVDQQPYLQGYLPIVQLYMMKKYRLGAWDVNTGKGLVTKDNVEAVAALSKEGIR